MDNPLDGAPERRVDAHLAAIIERAVKLQRIRGNSAATEYLLSNGIPQHTILRALASAAFRRKIHPSHA